jgi:predicted Rossmann-fold nucleotide-binding protein
LRKTVLLDGKISEDDLDMLQVTDDVDEAVRVIVDAQQHRDSPEPGGGAKHESSKRPD